MNQPQKPADPPTDGAPPNANPNGTSPNGIPDGMAENEAKGTPSSDREQTETEPHE